jgi:phospholipid N-methyltransferase
MYINIIKDEKIREKVLFIKKFVKCPRTIGSIAPSSPYLTESILSGIEWEKVKTIAELGAGTGVFTRQIIKKMSCDAKLLIFEIEPEFRERLHAETKMKIYADAAKLPQILEFEGITHIDLVVSSIPFCVIPREITDRILEGVVKCMNPEGIFLAYQYSLQMKLMFEKLFYSVDTRFVSLNIPPAFVYECKGLKTTVYRKGR